MIELRARLDSADNRFNGRQLFFFSRRLNVFKNAKATRGMLCGMALCAAVCIRANVANAQQFSPADFAPAHPAVSDGWWSPERTSFATLTSRAQLNVPKLANRVASPHFTQLQPNNPYLIEYSKITSGNSGGFEFTQGRAIEVGSAAVEALQSPQSFSGLLRARYLMWESSLAANRDLMNIDGALAYPLVQISYANWRLPISLYEPPLRMSVGR
jgi:hypothetical protein